jgi:L-aspartate oxidase
MSEYVGAVRTPNGLNKALEIIKETYTHLESSHLVKPYDFKVYNMCQTALAIINGAINRKESIGAHYIVEDK